jgi:uncharacterized protein (DUF924 family)
MNYMIEETPEDILDFWFGAGDEADIAKTQASL